MSKFCKNCGKELKEGADVCVACGKAIEETPTVAAGTPNPAQGKSVAALITGIASIVLCWIPFVSFACIGSGIAAIVLGSKARKESPQGKTGMATAGLVLGIIGVCLSAIYSICYVCTCAAAGEIENAFGDIDWSDYTNY